MIFDKRAIYIESFPRRDFVSWNSQIHTRHLLDTNETLNFNWTGPFSRPTTNKRVKTKKTAESTRYTYIIKATMRRRKFQSGKSTLFWKTPARSKRPRVESGDYRKGCTFRCLFCIYFFRCRLCLFRTCRSNKNNDICASVVYFNFVFSSAFSIFS